jgi:hypothetical protein
MNGARESYQGSAVEDEVNTDCQSNKKRAGCGPELKRGNTQ